MVLSLNLGGTGTVVVKARVEDGVDDQPYLTDWTHGLKFNGDTSTAKQVRTLQECHWRQNAGTATNNSDDSKTSADTNARPWATTVVFKSDGDNSESTDQYIWNQGEGIEETDNNIYLKQNSSGELYFGWGKNSDKNELALGITVNTSRLVWRIYCP